MSHAQLEIFLDTLADAAAAAVKPHFRTRIDVEHKDGKGEFDPVTIADRAAEAAMRTLIRSTYPDHGIVGEEYGPEAIEAEHVWVLDPIDGTRAFISGLPTWGTLIGLERAGRPVLGMMSQPFTGERFAGDTQRAWYRGPDGARALKTRPCTRVAEATVMTTSPHLFKGADAVAYHRVERQAKLARYGVDCYAYAMVAAGMVDLVIETGLQSFDIVALIPIIEGAGGIVTNWEGQSARAGGRVLASGDPSLHAVVLDLLNEA
jgi:myo-inositol-1(or 4)-monophosphatase